MGNYKEDISMKYIYTATFERWSGKESDEITVVASSIDRAIVATRKHMRKEGYDGRAILSLRRDKSVHAVD